ncbi:HAMP domain-containing histidine kinase [Aquihabitans sp. G128]|nr:histidine kinase dimerization/phospho-acceptor domain-containing protein [Aquihabitans sp. G128]QXC62628.1 HAMP domain-containing histidine kinase [Aquihabitans sp. G128]
MADAPDPLGSGAPDGSHVPNPAGPEGREPPAPPPSPGARTAPEGGPDGDWRQDDLPLSRPSRRLVQLADALPDWVGSVRFRLTALYSLVLFALAAFMVAGLYAVLASRLNDEKVYRTYQVTQLEPVPGGVVLTPTQVRAEYRSVEQLANARALNLLRTYSLSALVLLFLASLIVGWLVAGRVLAPIGRITAVARDISVTDLSRRIALRGPPDELKELADTFDAMLARLDDAFDSQQRFIQETSHELRNPLAVIRTNLDVALSDPDADTAELRRTAELVGRSAARMSRLVDDLLVYARRGAPAHDIGSLDLATVVREAEVEFGAPAHARGLSLQVDAEPGLLVVGDRVALRRALANLLTNAVRLAPEGSAVSVGAGRDGDRLWMAVADEGPGIAPEDRDKVFQRFWRGNAASARGRAQRPRAGHRRPDRHRQRRLGAAHRVPGGRLRLHDLAPGGSLRLGPGDSQEPPRCRLPTLSGSVRTVALDKERP